MTGSTFVLLSGTLTFGVPLALGVWELLTLPTFRRGGDEPPPEERHPRAPKPVPTCLLPPPGPARASVRVRVLEDA